MLKVYMFVGLMPMCIQAILAPSMISSSGALFFMLMYLLKVSTLSSNSVEGTWSWMLGGLAVLTVFLITLAQAHSFSGPNKNWFILMMNIMCLVLIGCFYTESVLFFYIMFEASALVIFFFILSFGYQPERFTASLYLLLFTALSALPFVMAVLVLAKEFGALSFEMLKLDQIFYTTGFTSLVSLMLGLGFIVKFPMYMFHIWLPKAHVEASSSGSMLLAGILLKLGTYGLFRVSGLVSSSVLAQYVLFFSLVGGLIVSIICCRLVDFKVLIAYSSVAHMSLVISGVLTSSELGEVSSLGMSLGHGVISSALFFGAGLYYSASGSRLFIFNKSTMNWAPWFTFFWFLLCASNMGTPPSFNFWMELFLIFTLMSFSPLNGIFLAGILFFGVVFNILLYLLGHSGKTSYLNKHFLVMNFKDFNILSFHFLLSVALFFMLMFK